MEERRRLKTLLTAKARILESWLDLSLAFARALEQGFDESKLKDFQDARASLLKSFELHEKKITETATALREQPRDEAFLSEVRAAITRFGEALARISEADDRVFDAIRAEQARIRQDYEEAGRGARAIGRFKSGWAETPSGAGLDREV